MLKRRRRRVVATKARLTEGTTFWVKETELEDPYSVPVELNSVTWFDENYFGENQGYGLEAEPTGRQSDLLYHGNIVTIIEYRLVGVYGD